MRLSIICSERSTQDTLRENIQVACVSSECQFARIPLTWILASPGGLVCCLLWRAVFFTLPGASEVLIQPVLLPVIKDPVSYSLGVP